MAIDRRFRSFSIPLHLIATHPDIVAIFMIGMVVLDAKCSLADKEMQYSEVWNAGFPLLEDNQPIPEVEVDAICGPKADERGILRPNELVELKFRATV